MSAVFWDWNEGFDVLLVQGSHQRESQLLGDEIGLSERGVPGMGALERREVIAERFDGSPDIAEALLDIIQVLFNIAEALLDLVEALLRGGDKLGEFFGQLKQLARQQSGAQGFKPLGFSSRTRNRSSMVLMVAIVMPVLSLL